jgi:hypothetical protein
LPRGGIDHIGGAPVRRDHRMNDTVEQGLGILLGMAGMLDLFVTVLYARIGSRKGSRLGMGTGRWIARGVWATCRALAGELPGARTVVLSVAAPLTLVALLCWWAVLLTLGAAMVIHPVLGSSVRHAAGAGGEDFGTALYVAGSSLSIVSNSDFQPQTTAFRLVFLMNALVGASMITFTITYLMQVYRALQTRNALGMKIHMMGAGTGSAVELLARWGPQGRFDVCYSSMAEVGGELAEVHEAHHLYPLVFYFRFDTEYPNLPLYLPVLLEASSLIECALADGEYAWLRGSAVTAQLARGPLALLHMLESVFVPACFHPGVPLPQRDALEARFADALRVLKRAGIATAGDEAAAATRYVASVGQWLEKSVRLAAYLGHDVRSLLKPPGDASGRAGRH